jgi:hypothetical protein
LQNDARSRAGIHLLLTSQTKSLNGLIRQLNVNFKASYLVGDVTCQLAFQQHGGPVGSFVLFIVASDGFRMIESNGTHFTIPTASFYQDASKYQVWANHRLNWNDPASVFDDFDLSSQDRLIKIEELSSEMYDIPDFVLEEGMSGLRNEEKRLPTSPPPTPVDKSSARLPSLEGQSSVISKEGYWRRKYWPTTGKSHEMRVLVGSSFIGLSGKAVFTLFGVGFKFLDGSSKGLLLRI